MSATLLEFKHVVISYPGKAGHKPVNFDMKEHDHIAFAGNNRLLPKAIMDTIAGKTIVSQGSVHFHFYEKMEDCVNGQKRWPSPYHYISCIASSHSFKSAAGAGITYYQQRYNAADADRSLTVREYFSGIKPVRSDVLWTQEKITTKLKLENLLEKHLIKLSNGEAKRCLLAAALLRNPVILLLEDLFSGLDTSFRKDILSFIDEIAATGIQIIMTTLTGEIPSCINRVITFNEADTHLLSIENNNLITLKEKKQTIHPGALNSLLMGGTSQKFEVIVRMKEVTIRYNEQIILNRINWTIRQGERWLLSGPNGAGKTTLLSLINADNPQAFANDIVLFDRKKGSGESIWDIKKYIGFFSAELYQFFPRNTSCLSAVESGFYDTIGLYRPSHPSTAGVAARWLQLLNLDHLSSYSLKRVTPSERRWCLIIRALVKNPPLLILDEPCQNMEPFEKLLFKKLIDLICHQTNITLIYVSHYAEEIPQSITHFFKLEKGTRIE